MTQKVAVAAGREPATEDEKRAALKQISKARTALFLDRPFYGALCLRMPLIGDHPQISTMAVDGTNMYYDSKWVNDLPLEELKGVLAHELLHVVYMHMLRVQDRDHKLWNVATDFAINRDLLKEGFKLPENGCIDRDGKYNGMTAEAIYQTLLNDPEWDNCRMPEWGMFIGQLGEDGESPTDEDGNPIGVKLTKEQAKQIEANMRAGIANAATLAKQAGKLPGHIEEHIKELFRPKVNWRAVLWPFITDLSEDEYSWNRPHRGYISEGEYFPSMKSEGIDKIVFAIDTSGSMSNKEIAQCWSEIVAVCEQMRPKKLICIQCDSHVQSVDDIDVLNARGIKFSAHGRGGTNVTPVFEEIEKNHRDTCALVYLTDMGIWWDSEQKEPPPYPILWISTRRDQSAPYGEVVHMEMDT